MWESSEPSDTAAAARSSLDILRIMVSTAIAAQRERKGLVRRDGREAVNLLSGYRRKMIAICQIDPIGIYSLRGVVH